MWNWAICCACKCALKLVTSSSGLDWIHNFTFTTQKWNSVLKSAQYPIAHWPGRCAFSNLLYVNSIDATGRCLTVCNFKVFLCLSWKYLNFFWSCLFSFQQKDCKNVSGAKRFHTEPYQWQLSMTGHNGPVCQYPNIVSVNHIPTNVDQGKAVWGQI